MRWSTTIALIALEKLRQRRQLEETERCALVRLAEDLQKIAATNEDLEEEVLFVRRLSGHRPSGSLRRLLAMNSPKLSAINPSLLVQVGQFVERLAATGFAPPSLDEDKQALGEALSTCQAVLSAI